MRMDYLQAHFESHMGRRDVFRLGAAAAATGAIATIGRGEQAAARADDERGGRRGPTPAVDFDDEMFDVVAVLAGAWDDTAFYQRGDQRGTLQEVTPDKTEQALRLLKRGRPTETYNLGELMFSGFPAYNTIPPRAFDQRLVLLGYPPPAGFEGYVQGTAPSGPNQISAHEERFRVPDPARFPLPAGYENVYAMTNQIATQFDNLNHVGVGSVFYGGHRGPDIAETWGTNKLGAENMGPVVTRGIMLDILALKLDQGASGDLSQTAAGRPLLVDNYRITVEDIEAAMRRQRIRSVEPGDAVLFRTGWGQLLQPKDPSAPDDPLHPDHPEHARFLAMEPGIYLREARYLASRRPALIGGDTWALEVLGNPVSGANAFPVHQELITHHGVRIAESVHLEGLAQDGINEFVYIVTPNYASGATAGNTPPAALAQPSRR